MFNFKLVIITNMLLVQVKLRIYFFGLNIFLILNKYSILPLLSNKFLFCIESLIKQQFYL